MRVARFQSLFAARLHRGCAIAVVALAPLVPLASAIWGAITRFRVCDNNCDAIFFHGARFPAPTNDAAFFLTRCMYSYLITHRHHVPPGE